MKRAIAQPQRVQTAAEEIAIYCSEHPGSPTAVRRPRVSRRGQLWIALLGENIQRGIAGFGPSIQAALNAFDRQYLNSLRPPDETRVPFTDRYSRRAA